MFVAEQADLEDQSPLDHALAERDRGVVAMVRQAIDHQRFRLAYQPVVRTQTPQRRPAYYEGLIRILDSTGRIIPARDFMATVETQELGRRIDCMALDLALGALKQYPNLRLAVNLSARSLGFPGWTRRLERALSATPGMGERLILEISEDSAMTMPDMVAVFMEEWQPQGVAFALDNFGAGYTAFRHFRECFFDMVKIDPQFIRGIHESSENQVLCAALISVARHFEMFTIAEAVENAQEAAVLTDLGVDCMQGYLFAGPSTQPPWMGRKRRVG